MPEFSPRYLAPDQLAHLYTEALVQAEAQVANAWINYQLAPHDAPRRAAYEQGAERLDALRADFERVLKAAAANTQPSPAGAANLTPASPPPNGRTASDPALTTQEA